MHAFDDDDGAGAVGQGFQPQTYASQFSIYGEKDVNYNDKTRDIEQGWRHNRGERSVMTG